MKQNLLWLLRRFVINCKMRVRRKTDRWLNGSVKQVRQNEVIQKLRERKSSKEPF